MLLAFWLPISILVIFFSYIIIMPKIWLRKMSKEDRKAVKEAYEGYSQWRRINRG